MSLTLKQLWYTYVYQQMVAVMTGLRHQTRQRLFNHIDRTLDGVFHMINRFRRYQLYAHPSKVTIDEMNAVEDAFLSLADLNRKGQTMSIVEVLGFLFMIYREWHRYAKPISYMEEALEIHAFLREAFGLNR